MSHRYATVYTLSPKLIFCSIYQLEKTLYTSHTDDPENTPLIPPDNPDRIFVKLLDAELEKTSRFYDSQESEILGEIEDLLKDHENLDTCFSHNDSQDLHTSLPRGNNRTSKPKTPGLFWAARLRRDSLISDSIEEQTEDSEDDEIDENTTLRKQRSGPERHKSISHDTVDLHRESSAPKRESVDTNSQAGTHANQICEDCFESEATSCIAPTVMSVKKGTVYLYIKLCELKSFVQLNRTGFSKALKKYDKILGRNLKSEYIDSHVNTASLFRPDALRNLDENIEKLEQVYAKFFTNFDLALARRELRLNVREQVMWQRNTVWREMIGIERKTQAARFGLMKTILEPDNDHTFAQLQGDDELEVGLKKKITTPLGKFFIPKWLNNSALHYILVILLVFFFLLYIPMNLAEEQQNCLAMLVFVSLLWATEVR